MTLPAISWLPSPYKNLRDARYAIRGVVSHRIVGTLPSARAAFGVAPGTSRNASTHFGIGYVNGRLAIDQFVDLSDMAWGNGDVRDPSWPLLIAGVNPNLYTVSIEHEDGGSANRGRVSAQVWQASIELQRLICSGDLAAIRAAGVHVRYAHHVAQLAALARDGLHFIDHHQIAGPNKPYCFRRWLDDPGFVEGRPSRRDQLLAALNADMPDTATPEEDPMEWAGRIRAFQALVELAPGQPIRSDPRLTKANVIDTVGANGFTAKVIGRITDGEAYVGSTEWYVYALNAGGLRVFHAKQAKSVRPMAPDCGDAVAQAEQETAAKVNQAWRSWIGTAPTP